MHSLLDCNEMQGQQNKKKIWYYYITATMVTRTRHSVDVLMVVPFVGGAFVCTVDTKYSLWDRYFFFLCASSPLCNIQLIWQYMCVALILPY